MNNNIRIYSIRNQRSRRSDLGLSTLEFAMVLPAILAFVLGSLSVSRVFQAHTALEAGVKTAVRCVYAADGKCVNTGQPAPVPLFTWYKVNRPVKYEVPTFFYSGIGKWINMTQYTYNDIRATIPAQAEASYQQERFAGKPIEYAVTGLAPYYLLASRAPYFSGPDAEHVSAFYLYDTKVPYNDELKLVLNHAKITTVPGAGRFSEATATFTLNDPFVGRQFFGNTCYLADRFERSHGPYQMRNPKKCDDFLGDAANLLSTQTPIVVLITGESEGHGEVEAWLSWEGGDAPLGGRGFTGPGWGNFIPRGVPESVYIDDKLLYSLSGYGAPYTEWDKYKNLSVPFGKEITLHVKITGTDAAGWIPWSVKVFPMKVILEALTRTCDSTVKPSYLSTHPESLALYQELGIACKSTLNLLPVLFGVPDKSKNVSKAPEVDLDCALGAADAAALAAGRGLKKEDYEISVKAAAGACDPYPATSTCPVFGERATDVAPKNFGVPEKADGDGYVRNSAQALQICPATGDDRVRDAAAALLSVRWKEKDVQIAQTLYGAEGLKWTKESCQDVFVAPPSLAMIPENKLQLGEPQESKVPFYTGGTDPEVLIATQPERWGCPEMSPATKSISAPGSLFSGPQVALGDACYKSVLRAEAIRIGENPQEYMTFSQLGRGEPATLDTLPNLACGVTADLTYGEGGADTLVAMHLAEGVKPEVCRLSGSVCRSIFEGFSGAPLSTAVGNLVAAENFGVREVLASYPRATRCQGSIGTSALKNDCIDLKMEEVVSGQRSTYRARAEAQVPLLFGLSTKVSAMASREAERDFAR